VGTLSPEIAAAILGLAVGLPVVLLYNRLVASRSEARQGLAELDAQLKRRAELVPRLLERVSTHAAQENAILDAVAGLRSSCLDAPQARERFGQEIGLGSELRKLVLLQEAYPPLKADAEFADLAAKLAELEKQLEFARRFYNGAVTQYLTRLESFPDAIVAKLFRFKPMPLFETDARGAERKSGTDHVFR
jgi:LemA protein